MPAQWWKHTCMDRYETSRTVEVCPNCGVRAEYEGWGYRRLEQMACYQALYGLKPIGEHRPLANKLFAGIFRACGVCDGRGLLDVDGGRDFATCAGCAGLGHLPKDPARFDEVRREVLAKFPDAEAPPFRGEIARSVVVHDLARNEMLVMDQKVRR